MGPCHPKGKAFWPNWIRGLPSRPNPLLSNQGDCHSVESKGSSRAQRLETKRRITWVLKSLSSKVFDWSSPHLKLESKKDCEPTEFLRDLCRKKELLAHIQKSVQPLTELLGFLICTSKQAMKATRPPLQCKPCSFEKWRSKEHFPENRSKSASKPRNVFYFQLSPLLLNGILSFLWMTDCSVLLSSPFEMRIFIWWCYCFVPFELDIWKADDLSFSVQVTVTWKVTSGCAQHSKS